MRNVFSSSVGIPCVAAAVLVAACGGGDGGIVNTPDQPLIITVSPASFTLDVGGNGEVSVSISGGSTTNPATLASCSSASTAVATTTRQGNACLVTGVAPGNTTITASASTGAQASAAVMVTAPPPAMTEFTVAPVTARLIVGETRALVGTVVTGGVGVNVNYSYTSTNPGAAVVSAGGVVTGVSPDTASIIVVATASGAGFTSIMLTAAASITVTSFGVGFGSEQFASIPAGSYLRGTLNGVGDDRPVRSISIGAFRMQRTEVTQGQWRTVMSGTAIEDPAFNKACGDPCPVERVSWDDVQQFLTRLNQQDPGKGYRLPTEAEWEYAARAGTTGDYNVAGQSIEALGWVDTNSDGSTHPVAQKLPNAFGLYDMHGNIFEWVNDWYDGNYYASSPSADPTGPASGESRVIRGGAWFYNASVARSWYRGIGLPNNRSGLYGFRLARLP